MKQCLRVEQSPTIVRGVYNKDEVILPHYLDNSDATGGENKDEWRDTRITQR